MILLNLNTLYKVDHINNLQTLIFIYFPHFIIIIFNILYYFIITIIHILYFILYIPPIILSIIHLINRLSPFISLIH